MNEVLLTIYFIIIVSGIIKGKSKVIFGLTFVMAWVLIAGNYSNPDYEQYVLRYESGLYVTVDIGYSFICNIFYNLGWSFGHFKYLLSFVCLLLIFRTLYKFSRYPALSAALFLLFPLIVDITQLRNFVAYSIVFTAIPYLFEDKKLSTLKYVAIVMIAATVHITSAFYLLFVLSKYKVKAWHIVLLAIGAYLVKESAKLLFTIRFETNKLETLVQTSMSGFIFNAFIIVASTLLIWHIYNEKKNLISSNKLWVRICYENTWLLCNLAFLIIIPFMLDNGNYSRIFRNMAIMNVIFIANSYYLKKESKILYISAYYLYFVVFNYLWSNYFNEIFYPIFAYNSFL